MAQGCGEFGEEAAKVRPYSLLFCVMMLCASCARERFTVSVRECVRENKETNCEKARGDEKETEMSQSDRVSE